MDPGQGSRVSSFLWQDTAWGRPAPPPPDPCPPARHPRASAFSSLHEDSPPALPSLGSAHGTDGTREHDESGGQGVENVLEKNRRQKQALLGERE